MYQVHAGTYVALLMLEKTDYSACHPKKTTTYSEYILHVVPITTHSTTQKRLPRKYYTWYLSLRIRRSDSSQLKKRKQKKRPKKEIKDTKAKKKRKRTGIELLKRLQA